MDRNRLHEMAANPNNIPGIYNYCDRWCQRCTFTSRCLQFQMEQEEIPEILEDMPKDFEGSAKIALIAIDRSMAAWAKLMHHFPEKEDETLKLLVLLGKLRRSLEHAVPGARGFVRPGFDE